MRKSKDFRHGAVADVNGTAPGWTQARILRHSRARMLLVLVRALVGEGVSPDLAAMIAKDVVVGEGDGER